MFPSGQSPNGGSNTAIYRPAYSSFTTSTGTLVTALSVNGTGMISGLFALTVSGVTTLKVTIDGNVVLNDTNFVGGTNASISFPCNWYFNRSLLVEAQSAGANNLTVKVAYSIA